MKKSVCISWQLFMAIVFLGGCGADLTSSAKGGQGGETELTPYDLSLDGSTALTGQVADGETSVEIANLSATEYVRQVVIDLGAHFLPENICAGNTIFGRLGVAMCPEEISSARGFRSSGSLTMKQELEAGTCSDTDYATRDTCEQASPGNIWTPTVMSGEKIANTEVDTTNPRLSRNAATFRHNGTIWVQADIPGSDGQDGWSSGECGLSGNIFSRISNCNRQWQAMVGSRDGGGLWSLVSRQDMSGTKYEIWRDNKTGLVWSDDMGWGDHCAAAGDNASNGWCESNYPITESVCAETGFAQSFSGNIRGLSGGVYDARKGGMGLTSTTNPVLWRLPTLKDYMEAYANGMAFVLPNLNKGFWTASVAPTGNSFALNFFVYGNGEVSVASLDRDYGDLNYIHIRCVGR